MLEIFAPLLTPAAALAVALVAFAGVLRGFSGFGSAMVLAPTLAALLRVEVPKDAEVALVREALLRERTPR